MDTGSSYEIKTKRKEKVNLQHETASYNWNILKNRELSPRGSVLAMN